MIPTKPSPLPTQLNQTIGFFMGVGVVLLCMTSRPSTAQGHWAPGILLGGTYHPNFATNTANGGSLFQIDMGYMWEKKNWSIGLSLPVETDFGTRVSLGPQVRLEVYRYFRITASPMFEIPFQFPAYSIFFVRGSLEFGFRNTGQYAVGNETPVKAGLYLFVTVDGRIPMPNQQPGQEFRMIFGFRIETFL
ncbi:MAG: hypothetical protein EP343_31480 [Deltaproteobacteria bacterium]|nr:MAG: hypothetical protein EP343_31480 [Deltaproteobacteria bacterium]